jgi:hypothetical protein
MSLFFLLFLLLAIVDIETSNNSRNNLPKRRLGGGIIPICEVEAQLDPSSLKSSEVPYYIVFSRFQKCFPRQKAKIFADFSICFLGMLVFLGQWQRKQQGSLDFFVSRE